MLNKAGNDTTKANKSFLIPFAAYDKVKENNMIESNYRDDYSW